jgi:hypothetical protein
MGAGVGMSPDPSRGVLPWRALLRRAYAGASIVILDLDTHSAATRADCLRRYGARSVLAIGATASTELTTNARCLDVSPGDAFSILSALAEILAAAPSAVTAWLDRHDPERAALVLLPPAVRWHEPHAWGRRFYGHRPPAWERWEDKTFSNAALARLTPAPVQRAVVPTCHDQLVDAARRVLAATPTDVVDVEGTVWSADASRVPTGQGLGSRWVRATQDAVDAAQELAALAPTARVMPFVEGLPCSIHGVVATNGDIAAGAPVEILTLRRSRHPYLEWYGNATYWRPPNWLATQMRETLLAVGAALVGDCGFRGAYSVDGVATRVGFVPTEINPRIAGGLTRQLKNVRGLDVRLLNHVIVAEEAAHLDVSELQGFLAHAQPSGTRRSVSRRARHPPSARALSPWPAHTTSSPR